MSTCQEKKDFSRSSKKDSSPSLKSFLPENQPKNKRRLSDIKHPLKPLRVNSLPRNHGKEEKKKEPREDNKDKNADKTDHPEEKVTTKPEVEKEEEVDPEENE